MIHGIGLDIVDIDHMERAVKRHPRIIYKILTEQERNELIPDGVALHDLHGDKNFVETIAGRFAAKEALVKSLTMPLFAVGMCNISIVRNALTSAPDVQFDSHKLTGESLSFLCSITHTHVSAAAVVIAQKS